MPVALKGSTSGQVTITAPAVAGSGTLTAPAVTGNIITSADSGTVTQAMMASNVAGNGPAFSAYITNGGADQGITSSTFTKAKFDTLQNETTSSGFDTSNNWFKPTVAGWYQLNAVVYTGGTSATFSLFAFYKGTTSSLSLDLQSQQVLTATSQTPGLSGSHLLYMNGTTDVVAIYGYSNGSSAYLKYGSALSRFTGVLVRAA